MKQVWGLGAAVLSLLLIVLFWTVYVTGRLATTERLAPSEAAEGIEVPVIGTVGDFPEPERRLVVNVTADGRIVVDGETLTFEALTAELKRRADALHGELLLGSHPERWISGAAVVLRLDGALPWGAGLDLYIAAALAGFRYVTFAVRHEGDGADGAIAVFGATMGDHSEMDAVVNADDAERDVLAAVGDGSGRDTPATLCASLAASRGALEALYVRLDVDPRLPTRTALALLDASLRGGARWGRFVRPGRDEDAGAPEDGRVPPLGDYPSEIARPRSDAPNFGLRIGGYRVTNFDVVSPAAAMPSVARVRGRAAGITWGRDRFADRPAK